MIKLFAKNAAKLPGILAFQIHQVVAIFHTTIEIYVRPKNFFLFFTLSANHNIGNHATKIKNVRGDTGHEAHNNSPPMIAMNKLENRFKQVVLVKIKVYFTQRRKEKLRTQRIYDE